MNSIIEKYMTYSDFKVKNISVLIRKDDIIETFNYSKNELYDIASITKLFTLKLVYELLKEKVIDLDLEVMPNYTVENVLKMQGHLSIDKKLKESSNILEFKKNLKTVKILDMHNGEYTDLGMIKLQFKLEEITGKSYKELMEFYVLKPLDLKHTMYNPKEYILYGNGNTNKMPHDMKTRVINGVSAAAGIFTNVIELNKVADKIFSYNFFDKEFLDLIYNYEFLDSQNRRRSFAGLYLRTLNNKSSYIPDSYSNKTIAHQGFTGGITIFDPVNKRHISILVDAIENNNLVKSEKYFEYFHKLKEELFEYSLTL